MAEQVAWIQSSTLLKNIFTKYTNITTITMNIEANVFRKVMKKQAGGLG
jgi:hypothetical protein